MNWFKSDKEKTDASIKKAMTEHKEYNWHIMDNSLNNAHTKITELEKQIKILEFKLDNPKKYKLGQVVNGYTVFEINYLDHSIIKFHCFNTPSWEYKGINKQGEILVLS